MTTRYAHVHDPSVRAGPGDARPTAQQIIKDNNLEGALADKVILITGTSSGIGIETVRALHSTGAKIYAAARNLAKAQSALADILSSPSGQKVELLELDTADFASVRRAAVTFLAKEQKLNILINNAGIMALPQRELTKDGHEAQFQTNHLGHFLLFQLLKSALLAASSPQFQSRVVNVSSIGHRSSQIVFDDLTLGKADAYSPWAGYGQSKTANIYMANEIERRYGAAGLHAWSLHPGGIDTGLQVHIDMKAMTAEDSIKRLMKSPEQGASTTVLAAVDKELEGTGGKYLDDCDVSPQLKEGEVVEFFASAAASWAYDVDSAKKLWEVSCQIVGVSDD